MQFAAFHIREHLHVGDIMRGPAPKLQRADDPIPVRLRIIADTMRIDTGIDIFYTIVYPQCNTVPARRKKIEAKLLRRPQRIENANKLIVHPKARFPVTSFQKERDMLSLPPQRYHYRFLIPGRPNVVFYRLQTKGDLDIPFPAVTTVRTVFIIVTSGKITDPFCIRRDCVSLSIARHRTRQVNFVAQTPFEPSFTDSFIQRIGLKIPLPRQIDSLPLNTF